MSAHLSVRPIHESNYDQWTRFAMTAPSGSIFALPGYLEIFCAVAGGRFSIVGVYDGDELVGGMPLYLRPTKLGMLAAGRSLLAYHSPVIREYTTKSPAARTSRQNAILTALANYLRTVDCVHMVLHVRHTIADIRPFQGAGWQARPNYTYWVDISDLPSAWERVDQNLRRLISRATDRGLVCTEDDDFDSFYRLHLAIHKRKKSSLYLSEPWFRTYFQRVKALGLCRLYHARLPDGRSVATQLVLTGPYAVSHTVCAGSDEEFLATGASPFLRWKAFESLAGLGYAVNDLTGASYPSDVSRFKSQLGGDLVANWLVTRPLTLRYRLRDKVVSLMKVVRTWMHVRD